ncbi:MAG TPA: folylpolyglutamate synthase/dihydrofolate synthase family protein [Methylomirabilota bacterium]|nr:folylpolyglutamate synthase/dihydrofolate synthase family protein [Methylomirabilota bacterium]
MTYAEAVARLTALRGGEHAGIRPGLERIEGLLAALGHPESRYAIVQVGGTNGKGSVAAMLATILKAAGRRVGLYTSPHLVSFRERIRVDAEAIGEDAVVDGVEALGTLVARFDATMFEATTALALDHFAREAVDVAVLEVGLGGRLDATTVGRPVAVILSRIDLDHEAVLGSTVEAIAVDKACIVRAGVAYSAAQAPEAARVIVARAEATGVPLLMEGRDLSVRVEFRDLGGQRIACEGPGFSLTSLHLPLLGTYQPGNALLAVAAAHGLGAGEAAVRAGLARARWPGRFQVVRGTPTLVLDAAHNPAGARALADSLRAYFPDRPLTLVLGVSRDKDAAAMLAALAPLARRLILTRAATARAAEPETLRALLPAGGAGAEAVSSVAEALDLATRSAETPVVCVAGSLFVVGEALTHLGGTEAACLIENGADSMGSLEGARDTS